MTPVLSPTSAAAPAPLLEIRDLHTHFFTPRGVMKAVNGVSLAVRRGEILAVVGESGCGKSVTAMSVLKLIATPPGRIVKGEILFEGRDLVPLTDRAMQEVRGEGIGMIFQEPMTSLNPVLTVGEQIAETLIRHKRLSRREAREKAVDLLDLVGLSDPSRRVGQYPHELSGGMRQRVMIAQAMLCEPKLLIADEPTTALDVTVQAEVLDLMVNLQKELGTAIALITHDMGVVARMCDRIKVMRHGAFVEQGNTEEIFANPSHDYTRKLLDAMPRINAEASPAGTPGEEILRVDDLKVHFPIHMKGGLFGHTKDLKAVDGVSFGLGRGETLGIVGESGCGKSTLARAVLRLIEPSAGDVSWLGTPLTDLDRKALIRERKDLQIVFQDPLASLDPRMTIADSIAEPLKTYRPEMTRRERKEAVIEMMERVGLKKEKYNRYPHELSGGQNQRVGIARAMINRPKMIICDEAVSALDVSIQAQIVKLLKDLQAEFGMSMLFISHDLSVVREISTRIMVLYLGRIVEMGDAATICTEPRHPYTRSLISAVPIPDPKVERSRQRIRLPGELPSPLDPKASLRFLPSRLEGGQGDYVPKLQEVAPGHYVAEHDPLEDIMARGAA